MIEGTSWGMGRKDVSRIQKKCAERIGVRFFIISLISQGMQCSAWGVRAGKRVNITVTFRDTWHKFVVWHMTLMLNIIIIILRNVKVAQIHYSAFNEALPLKLNWCKACPWNTIYFTFSKFILMQMLSSMCRIYLKMIAKVVKWSMHKVGCQGLMPTLRTLM